MAARDARDGEPDGDLGVEATLGVERTTGEAVDRDERVALGGREPIGRVEALGSVRDQAYAAIFAGMRTATSASCTASRIWRALSAS